MHYLQKIEALKCVLTKVIFEIDYLYLRLFQLLLINLCLWFFINKEYEKPIQYLVNNKLLTFKHFIKYSFQRTPDY